MTLNEISGENTQRSSSDQIIFYLFQANDAKVVSFHKLGQLSPQKKVQPSSPAKNVTFEKLGSLSPTKIPVNVSNNDIADLKARASRLRRSLAGSNAGKLLSL